jgi:hypothetical protein
MLLSLKPELWEIVKSLDRDEEDTQDDIYDIPEFNTYGLNDEMIDFVLSQRNVFPDSVFTEGKHWATGNPYYCCPNHWTWDEDWFCPTDESPVLIEDLES